MAKNRQCWLAKPKWCFNLYGPSIYRPTA